MLDTQFTEIAETVAKRASDLLYADVFVLNRRRRIVAASEPHYIGQRFDRIGQPKSSEYLNIPVHLDNKEGNVIVGYSFNGEDVPPRLAEVIVDLVVNQAAVVDQLPNQRELKNRLIHDLLHGLIDDEEAIVRQARILGMDLTPPRAVILVDASDYVTDSGKHGKHEISDAKMKRRVQLVIGSIVNFFRLPSDTICADIGNGEIAVLKASDSKNLETWTESKDVPSYSPSSWANLAALKRAGKALLLRLRSDTGADVNVSIGRYHPSVEGLNYSYQDARAALSLGRRFRGPNRVHCLDELGVAAFVGVSDERTKIDLARHLLSPLSDTSELVETLEAFFEQDCCPSQTAEALTIHRNTLSYRLDKIASLTGLDAREFDDAVQIRLALLLRSLEVDGELASHAA